jgi:Arc/MetJ-type ribon-helix-helix transcriptional regulator
VVKIATFMKKKLSINIEETTIKEVEDVVSEGSFRNNSHLIELAVKKLLSEIKSGIVKTITNQEGSNGKGLY